MASTFACISAILACICEACFINPAMFIVPIPSRPVVYLDVSLRKRASISIGASIRSGGSTSSSSSV